MNLNESIERDLEMGVAETEEVKGGACPPRRVRKPRAQKPRAPKPKQPQFDSNASSIVTTVKDTINPERPL